ncbi:unnamed protein product, partial [Nesidiocoris tenuis]
MRTNPRETYGDDRRAGRGPPGDAVCRRASRPSPVVGIAERTDNPAGRAATPTPQC